MSGPTSKIKVFTDVKFQPDKENLWVVKKYLHTPWLKTEFVYQ